MMKRTDRSIAAALCAAVLALTGCTGESASADEPVNKQHVSPGTTDSGQPAAPEEMPTLTVATLDNYYAAKSYADNLPVWREIERRTGIHINWEVAPGGQYENEMKMRLAEGENLPDIFLLPDANPAKAADDGRIIPLDELITGHAPNIAAFLRENPDIDKRLRLPDGKLYTLSSIVTGTGFSDPYGILIRKDWLDRLGLQEPKTWDEWRAVLKAFKENDPNGNGIPDEIPLLTDQGFRGLTLFGSAVGTHFFYSGGFYPDATGRVQYEWLSSGAKNLVEWLRGLYGDGLIDPEFLTKTTESYLTAIGRGQVGATTGFLNVKAKYEAAQGKAGDDGTEWVMAEPPGGPATNGLYELYGPLSGWYGISKDCENPQLAIRWLDYIYASEEGNRLVNFGIENVSYVMENGQPHFTELAANNPDGLDLNSFLRSLGAMPTLPWIRADKGPLSRQVKALLEADPQIAEQAAKVRPYLVQSIPLAPPTQAEKEAEKQIYTPIQTYVNLALAKMITGAEPVDWPAFTREIESLGVQSVLDIKQAQYERYRNG